MNVLRKIGAYLLGVFLLLLLGAALLHPSLLVIADWLGPLFGSPIYYAVTMAFLMLGDPIRYPSLLFIWVFVALLIGGVVRRRLGAVLVALLVWLTMIPITASIVFAIAKSAPVVMQGAEGPLGGLPPLPSGLTLTSIFEAPIIGNVVKAAFSAISGDVNGQALAEQIIGGLAVDLALKPVILLVGALIGVELGRFVQRRGIHGILPVPKGGVNKVGAFVLILCLCSTLMIPSANSVQFGDEAYTETMIGALDKKGRTYIGDLFMDTDSTLSGMGLSASDADGLAAAVVVSHSGVVNEFRKLIGSDPAFSQVSSLVNLLPPTFAVIVYFGVSKDVAAQRSVSVSRVLSSTYGVDLSQLTSISTEQQIDEMGNTVVVTFTIYQSSSDVGVLADNYLTLFRGRGGFVDTISGAVSNGRLVPGETVDSASGAIFAAGFVNVDTIKTLIPTEQMNSNVTEAFGAFMSGSVSFAGGVSFWDYGAQPSGGAGGFNLLNLLGTNTAPSYSPTSDFSFLLTFAPPGEDLGGGAEIPNVKIVTSVPLTQEETNAIYDFLEKMGYIVRLRNGVLSPSDFNIDTSGITLPLNVEVTKTITGGETATVTVTVVNRDTKPMTNVTISDDGSLVGYTTGVGFVSGDTEATWDVIPPGESRTITYTVRIDNPGVYTLEPARISYSDDGTQFNDSSNVVETVASRPLFLLVPFELAVLTWQTGSQLLDVATGRGVIIMSVVTLAIVLFFAWEGVKSYKRWKGGKEASVAPQSAGGDTPSTPP